MGWFSKLTGIAPARPHTGAMFTRADVYAALPGVMPIMGKNCYAMARADYVLGVAQRANDELGRSAGIFRWASNATCTLFTAKGVVMAQEEYYMAAFHDTAPASALAVFAFWHKKPGAISGHAVLGFLTDKGPLFVDVQAPGKFYDVTPADMQSMPGTSQFL